MNWDKRRPISLTLRVVLFVATAFCASLIVFCILVLSSIKHHFLEQDASEINVMVQSIERAIRSAQGEDVTLRTALANAVSGHHGVYYQVTKNNELIYSTPTIDFLKATSSIVPVVKITSQNLSVWHSNGIGYRGVVTDRRVGDDRHRIITAIDMDFHQSFLASFKQSLGLIILVASVFTLFAAWLAVFQGLKPLRGLSEKMGYIRANKLDIRLDSSGVPVELVELSASFNHMIGRLEEGFSRLSHFSADIAHELRTPLTNIATQTQVGLTKARTADEYRELLYSSLEELERLTKMVSDMLWLAKSENGLIETVPGVLNLEAEVKALFEFFDALAEERDITMKLCGQVPEIQGDRSLVRRALTNLLSNAIRHSDPGSTVCIRLANCAETEISVSVENPGLPIPAEHIQRIFDRFYRVDPSRQRHSEGTGLGLAIVKSIVEAHAGRVEAYSRNKITVVKLFFPYSRDAPT